MNYQHVKLSSSFPVYPLYVIYLLSHNVITYTFQNSLSSCNEGIQIPRNEGPRVCMHLHRNCPHPRWKTALSQASPHARTS